MQTQGFGFLDRRPGRTYVSSVSVHRPKPEREPMIVNCPSCRTSYRTAELSSGARLGRCSHCDETFDLAPRARQYVVLPLSTPLPVGMDDPSLAGQLERSGRAVDRVIPPGQSGVAVAETAGIGRRGARRPGREWFGLVLLTALGCAAGFHGAVIAYADPVGGTAAGAVGGLILGWSWIRAAERKR